LVNPFLKTEKFFYSDYQIDFIHLIITIDFNSLTRAANI